MSQVCSASVFLQLSLHPGWKGKAQLLSRRGGRTAHRLSPENQYGSDGSLPKLGKEKAISAWHFWPRGRRGEQTWGSKRFLFLPESNSWWGSDFISLVIIGLAGYPLEPHCIEWRARETSILLYGNCLAAILHCPLCDSKTNKHTLAPGFWRNLHRSEQGHFATQYGAGEGMACTLMPRLGSWMTFPSLLPPHEWHKFS